MTRRTVGYLAAALSAVALAFATVIFTCYYRSVLKETIAYSQVFPDGCEEARDDGQGLPDGVRTLVISYVGEPAFPYGEDRIRISVLEGRRAVPVLKERHTVYDTIVPVLNDGARGRFAVEWTDGQPVVTLSGDEMDDVRVVVPVVVRAGTALPYGTAAQTRRYFVFYASDSRRLQLFGRGKGLGAAGEEVFGEE